MNHPGLLAYVNTVLRLKTISKTNPLVFKQLFEPESSTYTYLLGDIKSGKFYYFIHSLRFFHTDNNVHSILLLLFRHSYLYL